MRLLRLLLTFLHVGVVLGLLGTLLNAYIPPSVIPFVNLLSLGFPILLIINVLLTLFWIVSWRKRAFVFLFSFVLILIPIRRWVNFSGDSKEVANFKMLSYNIKGGVMNKAERSEVTRFLDEKDVDVAFVQERSWEQLKSETYPYSSKTVMITQVLSKHKILKTEELFGDTDVHHAIQSDIEIQGKTYRFINVYLEPFSFKKKMFKLEGNTQQDKKGALAIVRKLLRIFKTHEVQVKRIHKAVKDSPYPVMVLGDFNSVPNSYEYYTLSKGLEDAFLKVGNGSATSFHDYKFPLRLDYILTSPEIKAVNYKVDRSTHLSDHYPIIAEFKLP